MLQLDKHLESLSLHLARNLIDLLLRVLQARENDKVYSLFTTSRQKTNIVIGCESGFEGRFINESLQDQKDLSYLNSPSTNQQDPSFTFNFDNVFNETHKQERFYDGSIRTLVKNFIEGENGTVFFFGPTDGGKTYSLKGKTGMDRGIVPRAIEDIFNIIRNSGANAVNTIEQNYSEDEEQDAYISNNREQNMFLKMNIYQIFSDKIVDLLSTSSSFKKVYVDRILDEVNQRVVSKIRNITDKILLSVEDFYAAFQEAFKNRRIQSVNGPHYQDLRKKSHLIINLTLMKRISARKLDEISNLNFVELCGSEQAVSQALQDQPSRAFVTQSFNMLSSSLMKNALGKKIQVRQNEEESCYLIDCLSKTLTTESNIALICCVNPSPSHYEHSLPAVKFCAKIRDSILKKCNKLNQIQKRDKKGTKNIIDSIKSAIQNIKEELAIKQIQNQQNEEIEESGIQPDWIRQKLNQIENLTSILKSYNQQDSNLGKHKDQFMMISELKQIYSYQKYSFIKDSILRISGVGYNRLMTPKPLLSVRDSYSSYHPLQSPHLSEQNGVQFSQNPQQLNIDQTKYQNSYDPYSQKSYNYPYSEQQENFNPLASFQQESIQKKIQLENQKFPVIYTDEDDQSENINTINKRNIQKEPSQPFKSDLKQNDTYQSYQQDTYQITKENDISQNQENVFLNRLHPLTNRSVSQRDNTSPKIQKGFRGGYNQPLSSYQKGFQTTNQSNARQDENILLSPESNHNVKIDFTSQSKSMFDIKNTTKTYVQADRKQIISQYQNQLDKINQDSVYSSQEEALSDLTRLFRLNDIDGLKLRIVNIFKEKQQTQLLSQQILQEMMNLDIIIQDQGQRIDEQDLILEKAQSDQILNIRDIDQKQQELEKNSLMQSQSLTDHLKDLQSMIKLLQEEKEQFIKAQILLEQEVKSLQKDNQELISSQKITQAENDRLKSNYDILKEHEMAIIRDTEQQKQKEVSQYEQRSRDLQQESKILNGKFTEMDQHIFKLKEELKKMDNENQKLNDDNRYLSEQIQKLSNRLEQEEESKQEILKQTEQLEKEYRLLEERRDQIEHERNNAKKEIDKLHCLIEKMESNIQMQIQKNQEEIVIREQKEREIKQLKDEKNTIEGFIGLKESEIEEGHKREQALIEQIQKMEKVNEEFDKQVTLFKAKEYDKVDILKKAAELEARMKYLAVDNENLLKERNQLDLTVVNLNREKQQLEQHVLEVESELDYLKQANEEHLDKFDQKFQDISFEITKIKNENTLLKEKEKAQNRRIKEYEEEADQLKQQLIQSDRQNQDIQNKLVDVEREIKMLLEEREKDIKDQTHRQMIEQRVKDENKGVILGDIQNMIKTYKDDKKLSKSGYLTSANNCSSTSTSVLY